jgi:hypothetical protein
MCPKKHYGSIGLSSWGSKMMFYQREFGSLHQVNRSGKMKIEYLLGEELEENSKNSKEDQWRVLGRVFSIQS